MKRETYPEFSWIWRNSVWYDAMGTPVQSKMIKRVLVVP